MMSLVAKNTGVSPQESRYGYSSRIDPIAPTASSVAISSMSRIAPR